MKPPSIVRKSIHTGYRGRFDQVTVLKLHINRWLYDQLKQTCTCHTYYLYLLVSTCIYLIIVVVWLVVWPIVAHRLLALVLIGFLLSIVSPNCYHICTWKNRRDNASGRDIKIGRFQGFKTCGVADHLSRSVNLMVVLNIMDIPPSLEWLITSQAWRWSTVSMMTNHYHE